MQNWIIHCCYTITYLYTNTLQGDSNGNRMCTCSWNANLPESIILREFAFLKDEECDSANSPFSKFILMWLAELKEPFLQFGFRFTFVFDRNRHYIHWLCWFRTLRVGFGRWIWTSFPSDCAWFDGRQHGRKWGNVILLMNYGVYLFKQFGFLEADLTWHLGQGPLEEV